MSARGSCTSGRRSNAGSRADQIDLVWFPTYVEDVNLPFVCQVFDLEHRMKPWFPEVSARGEWEHRERHYRPVPPQGDPSDRRRARRDATRSCASSASHPRTACRSSTRRPTSLSRLRLATAVHVERIRAHGIELPYLLYPGQFWAHKNHAAVLDALTELRSRGEQLSLVLVGSDKGQRGHVAGADPGAPARGRGAHPGLRGRGRARRALPARARARLPQPLRAGEPAAAGGASRSAAP